jgi:LmbE family N-acetylglucosaminyl deacetylase
MKERVTAHGGDTTRFDEMIMTRKQRAWPDHEIHIVVDVSEYVEQKWQAFHCHRTQFGPESRFQQLPEEEMKELLSTEYFALSHPAADKKLAGLFEGL